MDSKNDFRQRIAQVYAEAKAQDLSFNDIVPEDVQEHFQNELTVAKDYAKDSDEREADQRAKIEDLEKQLKEANEAIQNMPEDHEQRLQDLILANNSTKFYRELYEVSQKDIEKLEAKVRTAGSKQMAIEEAKLAALRLREECNQHKENLTRAVQQNRTLRNRMETEQSNAAAVLSLKSIQVEELEQRLETSTKRLEEKKEEVDTLEAEHDRIQSAYDGLFENVELQTADATARLNTISALRNQEEKVRMTTVSELVPLRRFFEVYFSVMKRYTDKISAQLASESDKIGISKSDFKAIKDEHDKVSELRKLFINNGTDKVREEVRNLAQLADKIRESLTPLDPSASSSGKKSSRSGGWVKLNKMFNKR